MTEQTARKIWDHLLMSGGYSIGYFSVNVGDESIRVFHFRTREVRTYPKESSYEQMDQFCQEHGYKLTDLLDRYYPKSFRSLSIER